MLRPALQDERHSPGKTATVTAVMPALNASATIRDALDSLLAQTRGDWDAVIIDDGSTDETVAIAKAYCASDRRFHLIRREHGGASAARNAGLQVARGDWILFLDSDDWIAPDFLEKMLGAAALDPRAGAVYCGYNRVAPDGSRLPQDWHEDVAADPFRSFSRGCPVAIHGIITRRELLLEVGGFDEELITCEDWDLWQKVARTGAGFAGIPETLAFYRLREGSLSTRAIQLMKDGLKVTARAWQADPRVPSPAPKYADGRNGDDEDGSPGYFVCWCAGEYAARGHDCAELFESIESLPPIRDRSEQLVGAVFDGIVAAGETPERVFERLPELDRRLGGFFAGLERATGRPGLARRLGAGLRELAVAENLVVRPTTRTAAVDIRKITGVSAPEGVDTVQVKFRLGEQDLGSTQVPVWGDLDREDVARAALRALYFRKLLRHGGLTKNPRFWAACAAHGLKNLKRLARALLRSPDRRKAVKSFLLHIFALAAADAYGAAGPSAGPSVARARQRIEEIRRAAEALAPKTALAGPAEAPDAGESESGDPRSDPRAFFEQVFEKEDPWDYTNAYETLKYEQTLGLLPAGRIRKAVEVACAEGHFTRMLAPRVDELLAVDIAEKAIERAQRRCSDLANVSFSQFDLIKDRLPEGLDLIVCSEVLYYLEDRAALKEVAERFRDALVPEGLLLMAHAYQLSDDPGRTGFDWGDGYGGQTISDVFQQTEGLVLERAIETELYRINLFRRGSARAAGPLIEHAPVAPLEPEVERYVVWGGAVARRSDLEAELTTDVPVLCYHRIGTDGPAALADYRVSPEAFAAQMRLLRRHGYHAITSRKLIGHIAEGRPLRGRPVLITFDDGYQDFADLAWPILRRNDFGAEVFIVTDRVGGSADWDAQYGPPAPLMDWPAIEALSREGVLFGSHLATHRDAQRLSPAELLDEAARSKAVLEARLGASVETMAAPFGSYDDRLSYILELCGYKAAYTTEEHIASVFHDAMSLPRIEVLGQMSLPEFAEAVGLDLEEEAGQAEVASVARSS